MDSRKSETTDDVIDLLLADRIKMDLANHCLRHLLATEGDSWLKPDRLVNVADMYMNSHEYGTSKTQKASTKFSGAD